MDKISQIYIADLGLNTEYIEILNSLGEKIEIVNTETYIGDSKKLFSKGWIDAVSQKTAVLHKLIESNYTPIIMLDSDTIITDDFSDIIDIN